MYAKKLTYFEVCDQEKFYGAQALTTDKHRREIDTRREKITFEPIKSDKNISLLKIFFREILLSLLLDLNVIYSLLTSIS
jgi:hypothetical protein